MKKILLLIMLVSYPLFGQWYSNAVETANRTSKGTVVGQIYFHALVDSVVVLTSNTFDPSKYDSLVTVFYKFTSAVGKPKITIKRQYYQFGEWVDGETWMTADSLETSRKFGDTMLYLPSRLVITGAAANRPDTILKLAIVVRRKE